MGMDTVMIADWSWPGDVPERERLSRLRNAWCRHSVRGRVPTTGRTIRQGIAQTKKSSASSACVPVRNLENASASSAPR